MGDGNFRAPTESHPLTDRQKFVTGDYVGNPDSCVKFGAHPSLGFLGEWVKYNIKLFLFMPLFGELTYSSDTSTDFRAWWLKRRGLAQVCAFLDLVDIAPHLGGR